MNDPFSYRNTLVRKNVNARYLLGETRCSEFYEFRHQQFGRCLLVVAKYSFPEQSEEEESQRAYLKQMYSVAADSAFTILEYGIDSEGYAFCSIEWLESSPLAPDRSDTNSILSAFIKCTTAVNSYHESGLAIGDLSISSFRSVNNQEVILLPCLGAFGTSEKHKHSDSGMLLAEHISPEQSINRESSLVSDIYALGVAGYYLATGLPEHKKQSMDTVSLLRRSPAPSVANTSIPVWYDTLIGNCIAADPARRIQSIPRVLDLLQSGVEKGIIDLPDVKWQALDLVRVSRASVIQRGDTTSVSKDGGKDRSPVTKGKKTSGSVKNHLRKKRSSSGIVVLLIWISTIVIGSGIALMLFLSFNASLTPDEFSHEVRLIYDDMGSVELRDNLVIFLDESLDDETRISALRKILGKKISWDTSFAGMVSKSKYAAVMADDFIGLFEKHSENLGYTSFIEKIVSTFKDFQSNSDFQTLFNSLALTFSSMDPAELPESRKGSMRRLYSLHQDLSFKVLALLAKDSSPHVFLPLLRDFIFTKFYKDIPPDLPMSVLFLLAPPIIELIDDLDLSIHNLSEQELRQLVQIIFDNKSYKNEELNTLVINHYVEQFELTPYEKYFLALAREQELSASDRQVFYKSAFNALSAEDIKLFFEWNDSRWEEVIYRLCVTSKDEKVLASALDVLDRRGPRVVQAAYLVKWLKAKFWSKRAKYAYAVGIFGLKDQATEEELEEAFSRLMPISQHGLFSVLVDSGDSYFITQAAERLSAILTSEEVVPYLVHEIKEVRIASVKALFGKNDLPTLQKIVRAYKKEKDPEIRELYNKYHWVTVDQEIPDSLKKNSFSG
jgi:hypothetical protein